MQIEASRIFEQNMERKEILKENKINKKQMWSAGFQLFFLAFPIAFKEGSTYQIY